MSKKWPPKGYQLVDGKYQLTDEWSLELPSQFARRVETGSLVLWRPGVTIWLDAYGNDLRTSRSVRLKEIRAKISAAATAIKETSDSQVTRLVYRLHETPDTKGRGDKPSDVEPSQRRGATREAGRSIDSVNAFVFSDAGHLQMAIYFDDPADEAIATAIANSVRVNR